MMTTFPNTELKKSLSLLFEMRLTNVRFWFSHPAFRRRKSNVNGSLICNVRKITSERAEVLNPEKEGSVFSAYSH